MALLHSAASKENTLLHLDGGFAGLRVLGKDDDVGKGNRAAITTVAERLNDSIARNGIIIATCMHELQPCRFWVQVRQRRYGDPCSLNLINVAAYMISLHQLPINEHLRLKRP